MPAKAKAKAPERDLFDEAGALVASAGRDVPREFVRTLFGRVPEEDLAPYTPQALADLAATAYEHLSAPRRNDGADLRLIDREVERGGGRRDITAIEVVNENMPFLLDSTLAELVEQGYEPRLVAHPILAVERDASGALARLVGEATAAAPVGARRESFIQIHLDRVDDEAARGRLVEGLTKVYADVAVSVRDWPGMRDPHRRGDLLLSRQSAAAAGRRGLGGGRLPRLARRRQFHLPRHARVPPAEGRRRRRSGRGIRPRPLARPRREGAAARRRARHHDARRSAPSSARPKALISHQGERQVARAPPRPSRLHRRQAVLGRRAPGGRVAHRRPVHRERLYELAQRGAVSAPQGRQGDRRAPASTRRAMPAARSSTCSRTIRATSCSRSTRTRSTASRSRS